MEGDGRDAPRYQRLGALYYDLADSAQARQAWLRAVELYRRQGAEQSDNATLLVGLGEVLGALGRAEEAERLLRKAVKVAPGDWRPQAALGRFLASQTVVAIALDAHRALDSSAIAAAGGQSAEARLEPAQAEKGRKLIAEALACQDRAVEFAPQEVEPYISRAGARCVHAALNAVLAAAGGDESQDTRAWTKFLAPAALSDLQTAVRLNGRDFRLLAAAALYEVFLAAGEHGLARMEDLARGAVWGLLPDGTRQSVRKAMDRLEDLTQGSEARPAAGALEALGILQYLVVRDLRGAESSLRRAVALDPAREQAWETLILLLALSDRPAELLPVCEARLKQRDTAHNRVLVAKACEQLNLQDRTLAEGEAAQRRYPDDLTANLALVAALLKYNSEPVVLLRAAQLLSKAEQLLGASASRDELVNVLVIRGLFFGLADRPDDARAHLRKGLELDPDHPQAREALELLE
jgi:tetratricopeptide (TPR) repeat protein